MPRIVKLAKAAALAAAISELLMVVYTMKVQRDIDKIIADAKLLETEATLRYDFTTQTFYLD